MHINNDRFGEGTLIFPNLDMFNKYLGKQNLNSYKQIILEKGENAYFIYPKVHNNPIDIYFVAKEYYDDYFAKKEIFLFKYINKVDWINSQTIDSECWKRIEADIREFFRYYERYP